MAFKKCLGGYLLVFVENLCNYNPKMRPKNCKNYISILAIANYRNWLDASPPLRLFLLKSIVPKKQHKNKTLNHCAIFQCSCSQS